MKTTIKTIFIGMMVSVSQMADGQCFIKINAGRDHVTAQKAGGTVWTWGGNVAGQLGNASNWQSEIPQNIGVGDLWFSTSAGRFCSMLIKSNGTLWCAGSNFYGELGVNSTTTNFNTLMQVGTATNWKQVASDNFTIAVRSDGTLWGWGQNDNSQMGDGSCCDNRLLPGQIGTATDWNKVGVSQIRSGFALKNNGTLWGWGSNGGYMLGSSEVSSRPFPTQLNVATDWADISVGAAHILAIKTNGTLWAWGDGFEGQTADGLPAAFVRDVPMPVLGGGNWKAISAGFKTSYGIKINGTLWAWGLNDEGQLGLGNTINQNQPVQVGTATNWNSVTVGGSFVAALKIDGSLWAWGDNFWGNLGNGTNTSEATAVQIPIAGCALGAEAFAFEKTVNIAPNPVRDDLQISVNGNLVFTDIVVFDVSGKQVYQTGVVAGAKMMVLNVASLSKGMYMVVFKNGNKSVGSKKVLKE